MFFFSACDHPMVHRVAQLLVKAGHEVWIGHGETVCPPNAIGVHTSPHVSKVECHFKRPGAQSLGIHAVPRWIVPCGCYIVIPQRPAHHLCEFDLHIMDSFRSITPQLAENLPQS